MDRCRSDHNFQYRSVQALQIPRTSSYSSQRVAPKKAKLPQSNLTKSYAHNQEDSFTFYESSPTESPVDKDESSTSRRVTLKQVMSISWFLICSLCFVVHLSDTCHHYLSYKTSSYVAIQVPDSFRPPAVSFCLRLDNVFDEKKIEKFLGVDCRRNVKKCNLTMFDYPVNVIMNNLTHSWNDVRIIYEKLLFGSFKGERTKWKEFYRHFQKCVKIELTSRILKIEEILKWWAEPSYILDLIIDLNMFKKLGESDEAILEITFHQSNILPAVDDVVSTHLDLKRHNEFEFVYREVVTKFLSHPYSNCANYKSPEDAADGIERLKVKVGENNTKEKETDVSPYDSAGVCYEQCRERMVHEKRGVRHGLVSTFDYNFTIGQYLYDDDIHHSCHANCVKPCLVTSFYPSISREQKSKKLKNYYHYHFKISDTEPRTTIEMRPAFPLADFVIFAASISGLWLGCSFHYTGRVLCNYLCAVFSSNQRNNERDNYNNSLKAEEDFIVRNKLLSNVKREEGTWYSSSSAEN